MRIMFSCILRPMARPLGLSLLDFIHFVLVYKQAFYCSQKEKLFKNNNNSSKGYYALVCLIDCKTTEKILQCTLIMFIAISGLANTKANAEEQMIYSINLPAQNAAQSLTDLSEQTDQMLLFSYDLAKNIQVNSVVGKYTIPQALNIMLEGTGFSGGLTAKGVLMISLTKSDSADEEPQEMKVMNKKKNVLASAIALLTMLGGAQVVAQPEAANEDQTGLALEEVMVTAQRRAENLQEVPISVQALSGETLERAGVESTGDLEIVTPGLVYTKGVGMGSPYLRGIGTASNGPGTENSVAVYVDGVYIGRKTSALTELANVERVEVLKGPQGTLFGRNATGGLIHIITKEPPREPEAAVKLGYGNFDTVTMGANAGGPFTDQSRGEFSIYHKDQREGYGENLATGNDVNREEKLSGRIKLLYDTNDMTRFTFIGGYAESENSFGTAYRLLDGAVPRLGPMFVMPANAGEYDVNGDVDPIFESDSIQLSLKVEHELSFADLTSISAYHQSDYFFALDSDVTPSPDLFITVANDEQQFSQEFKLSSQSDGRFEWTAGVYAYIGEGEQVVTLQGDFFPTLRQLANTGSQKTRSFAIYGQSTQQLGENTRLTGGLRYTVDEREIDGQRASVLLDNTLSETPIAPGEADFDKLTWRLALDHQITPEVLLYASYNRGFKSGLFNAGSLQLDPVRPEVLDAYEVGMKSDLFDRRLRVNTTAFYYDFQDIQLTQFVLGIGTLRNAAQAEITGFEIDSELLVTRDLSLIAGLSLLDGSYESFPGAGLATPNPAGGNFVNPGDASGNELARAPDVTATAALNYSTLIAGGNTFSFNINYSYNDGYYVEPDNVLRQGAHSLVNARAQLGFDGDRLLVSVWATNLTDEFRTTALTAQAVGDVYAAADPRRFGVTIEYHY